MLSCYHVLGVPDDDVGCEQGGDWGPENAADHHHHPADGHHRLREGTGPVNYSRGPAYKVTTLALTTTN